MAESQRLERVLGEDRLPFLQLPHAAADDLQRRRTFRQHDRLPGAHHRGRHVETLLPCADPPSLLQLSPHRLRLPLARRQRRHLHRRRAAVPALAVHIGQDLVPARRERFPQLPAVTRKLEARQPAHHRRHDRIALRYQLPRQPVAVIRPDQPRIAVQQRRLHALPPPPLVPGHVGGHRMSVELRIEVAACDVAEQRGHHPGRLHPRPPAGGGVPAPGLQQCPLDPVERLAHRRIVRANDRAVAVRVPLRRQKRRQRHRLRGRKRDVEARAVLALSVAQAPEPNPRPDHMAL